MRISGFEGLKDAADKLRAQPEIVRRAAIGAANDVARDIMNQASRDISQRYNLPAGYIKDKIEFRPAGEDGVAIVAARKRFTRLARFDARQHTAPAPRAKGDPRRKIQKGRKQAGVSVKVMRSEGRDLLKEAFFLPLRAGKEAGANGMGMFERLSSGRLKHLYGPSPFQSLRWWANAHRPEIPARIASALNARLARERRRVR